MTARPVVAAGHPATVHAAVTTLAAGGNAFDAVVAAGFAAGVAEPILSSLGGGGFLLARTADGDERLFDFFVDVPGRGRPSAERPRMTPVTLRFGSAEQVFEVGAGSVAVPGCLAGYLHVHRRLGRLPLADVLAPARATALDGVALGPGQAGIVKVVAPIYTLTEVGRARFAPGGRLVGPGDAVPNERLAAFLEDLALDRVRGFDDPALAARIAADLEAGGGVLTPADLAAYEVVEREPLVTGYRGARVATNPPPSYGGALVAHALQLLEARGPAAPLGSGERLVALAEALDAVRRRHLAGPVSRRGTTHVSVADGAGNLAAMTTSNGAGSGVDLADTGVMANNIMGEEDLHPAGAPAAPPGTRIGSMMAPTILDAPGRASVALGSGGSERIRSAITQVIANLVDHDLDLAAAVEAPRLHWDGEVAQIEPGHPSAAVAELACRRDVNEWPVTDLYFGGTHAVDTDGGAAGDPRRGGSTGAPDPEDR